MSNRRHDPWANPWKQFSYPNPGKQPSLDDFFGSDIKALKALLIWILDYEEVGISMKEMQKSQTLKGTVKRNERVYEVIITDITPDPEDVPDAVSIEWVSDFGEGHEDLTE